MTSTTGFNSGKLIIVVLHCNVAVFLMGNRNQWQLLTGNINKRQLLTEANNRRLCATREYGNFFKSCTKSFATKYSCPSS